MYTTQQIEENVKAIEFKNDFNGRNLVFRFTEYFPKSHGRFRLILNEFVDATSGKADFIYTDDYDNFSIIKEYTHEATESDIAKAAEEILDIGRKFTKLDVIPNNK